MFGVRLEIDLGVGELEELEFLVELFLELEKVFFFLGVVLVEKGLDLVLVLSLFVFRHSLDSDEQALD